jgi:glycosyltransferase involved in cell wall biosynthesis
MTPLVSLLIPVHNAEPFLDAALESARNQTHQNIEILCCDDASEDNSLAVLQRHAVADPRLRIFTQPANGGVVSTRNRLLAEARGEYFAWLDADDFVTPDRIEKQLAFMRADPRCGAVGTGVNFVDPEARFLRTESYPDDPDRQRQEPQICCASVLVRREAAESAGGFRSLFNHGGEDGDWLLRIADRWSLRNLPQPLYSYRVRPNSVSQSRRGEIRRLGVIARAAARHRRKTGVCPIDAGEYPTGSQSEVLASARLTAKEKTLALSFFDPAESPLVTVAIPFYGDHEFINECLESLARQTFQNFEVVVFDDGSESPLDWSEVPVAGEFSGDRLRSMRGAVNRGQAFARNRILDEARGRFVVFQDADDLSELARFWVLLEDLLADPDQAAVGSGISFVGMQGALLRPEVYPREAITPGGFNGCCASFMYDKSRAPDLRFDEGLRASSEDVEFLLRLEQYGRISNNSAILYRYRVNPKSTTAKGDWLASHTAYMWKVFARRRGVFDDGGLSPDHLVDLIFSADGTQTAELLLTLSYRQWRAGKIGIRRFTALLRLFPRSAFHILHQHFLLAVASRATLVMGWLRTALRLLGRAASVLIARPARRFGRAIRWPLDFWMERQKAIRVQILDNWGDADEALSFLLPGRLRRWDRVQFSTRGWFLRRPDYVLVLNHPDKPKRIRMSPNRVWFAIGEPPTQAHEILHLGQGVGTTVFTPARYPSMTSNGSSRKYRPAHAMTRTWWVKRTFEELNRTSTVPKTRMLSWVASNLTKMRGHRERLAFIHRARKALDFDLFGRGFSEISDKWVGIAPYHFSIAYENTRAPGYFTEKLMDCLVALTVPFYVGAPDIFDYFPNEAIILIDPDDPEVFDKMKQALTPAEYEKRLPALREAKHLVLHRYNMFVHLADAIMNDREPAGEPRLIRLAPQSVDWSLSQ